MKDKNHSNPIDLPEWPAVVETSPGVVTVSAKVRDPDMIEGRARKIGLLFTVVILLVSAPILIGLGKEIPYFDDFSLMTLVAVVAIGIGGWFGFMVVWDLISCVFGRAVNNLILFWYHTSVRIEFTSDTVEIVLPRRRSQKFDRKQVPRIEFHLAQHPLQAPAARSHSNTQAGGSLLGVSERFLDAFVVNFIYGGKVVHLLSTHTHQEAHAFVTCLSWAAERVTSGRASPSSLGPTTIAVDDRD